MRARIKGGVENVSRSVLMHHGVFVHIHAARDSSQVKKSNKNKSKIKIKKDSVLSASSECRLFHASILVATGAFEEVPCRKYLYFLIFFYLIECCVSATVRFLRLNTVQWVGRFTEA
jgi:hypothetical protein